MKMLKTALGYLIEFVLFPITLVKIVQLLQMHHAFLKLQYEQQRENVELLNRIISNQSHIISALEDASIDVEVVDIPDDTVWN